MAVYKHDRGIELESTEKQLQLSGQSGTWNPRPPDFKSGAVTTRPRCLHSTSTASESKDRLNAATLDVTFFSFNCLISQPFYFFVCHLQCNIPNVLILL